MRLANKRGKRGKTPINEEAVSHLSQALRLLRNLPVGASLAP